MVLGLCRYLLRDADEADDATQQTFLSAYRGLLGGTEPRDAGRWLAEIARNECRGRLAARIREPLPLDVTLEASDFDPVDTVDQTELLNDLKRAIADLPERQREAVVLRDFYGLSYREVATAMTVSVPVVESLLFRARRRLGTLPRLAQGALAIPLALRDELERAIPGFDSAAAGLGIAGGGAAAGGIAAKLAALPASAKIATATGVAAVAAGGAAVSPQMVERPAKPLAPPAAKSDALEQARKVKPRRPAVVEIAHRQQGAPAGRELSAARQETADETDRDDGREGNREPEEAREAEAGEAPDTEAEPERNAPDVEEEEDSADQQERRATPPPKPEPAEDENESGAEDEDEPSAPDPDETDEGED
jgi:RNA polymerase sigma-70 factor (ECF subfamily)